MVVPVDDVVEPYRAYAEKPNADDRRKQKPNSVCAIVLQRKQAYKYGARHWKPYICTLTRHIKHSYAWCNQTWQILTSSQMLK